MTKYLVHVETRQRGAIGIFTPLPYIVRANTPQEAIEKAGELARDEGYETRGYVSIRAEEE